LKTRWERQELGTAGEEVTCGYAARQGALMAQHQQRGHFKTFTEDAPLFGTKTGTFWWAPHVRGNASAGKVVKGFEITDS
jgi:hypothetical protein